MLTFGVLPPWASTPNRSTRAAAAAAAGPVAAAGTAGPAASAAMRHCFGCNNRICLYKSSDVLVVANTAYKSSVSILRRIVAKASEITPERRNQPIELTTTLICIKPWQARWLPMLEI